MYLSNNYIGNFAVFLDPLKEPFHRLIRVRFSSNNLVCHGGTMFSTLLIISIIRKILLKFKEKPFSPITKVEFICQNMCRDFRSISILVEGRVERN